MKEIERPEHIKCIRHEHADLQKKSWCDRTIHPFEWAFTSPSHAAYAVLNGDFLLPCPNCVESFTQALRGAEK